LDKSVQQIETQLTTDRPWRDIASLETDLSVVRAAYITARQRLLEWQEQQTEQAWGRIKARETFSTLTSDQPHRVLRPIALVMTKHHRRGRRS